MKYIFLVSLFFSVLGIPSLAKDAVVAEKKHQAQLRLLDAFLANHHYESAILDNDKSKKILKKYIELLDFGKYLFTKADVQFLGRYDELLDDFAHRGDLSATFDIYNTFLSKRKEHMEWVLKRLKTPFSDDEDYSFELDREKVTWAVSKDELEQRWEKMLLNSWIVLRLAKQSDEKARATLTKRYENMIKRAKKNKPEDAFQTYANALTSVYDPHTNYFSPRTGENFDINMSLSLEGIGAQLSFEEELITVKELIAGGPAKKSGELSRNDHILGVAQGKKGEMVDVVGWRLDEAVDLIRGKRGTMVRLQIQKSLNDEIVEVVLVRDKIKLEDSAAKSETKSFEIEGKTYRVGIIELPSFYIDFTAARRGDDNYRSTTRDVKKLIEELEKDGIDGLMIDLRNNGGGSLTEAIELTGLFFDEGPVVQVRRGDGDVTVHRDDDEETSYKGPLAVLINQHSASASEIFVGAIKDYGRGVVLGEPTFGKGTVQTVLDMSKFVPSVKEKVGQLKMTIAMFYRVNGSSTQLKGVKPDVYIPNKESYTQKGESEEEYALPWHKIDSIKHQQFNQVKPVLQKLQQQYDKDNADNPLMKNLLSQYAWAKSESDNTVVSLSLVKRKLQKTKLRDESLAFQNKFRKLYDYPLLTAGYLDKQDKDKSQADKDEEEKYEVDAIADIAAKTVADYIHLVK